MSAIQKELLSVRNRGVIELVFLVSSPGLGVGGRGRLYTNGVFSNNTRREEQGCIRTILTTLTSAGRSSELSEYPLPLPSSHVSTVSYKSPGGSFLLQA